VRIEVTQSDVARHDALSEDFRLRALATGGGLIFLGLTDGTVAAYDDVTLAELWKTNVGSGFNAPPMTFEVNGQQYVAIAIGLYATGKRTLDNSPELKDQRNATGLYVFGL
jgi:alcohol dehydrogenase (cytochrome c)